MRYAIGDSPITRRNASANLGALENPLRIATLRTGKSVNASSSLLRSIRTRSISSAGERPSAD